MRSLVDIALTMALFATAACGQIVDASDRRRASPEPGSDAGAPDAAVPYDGPTVGRCPVFPSDNPWNTDVSTYPLHPQSSAFIAAIGADKPLHPDFGTEWQGRPVGIPYVIVSSAQAMVPVEFLAYSEQSDPGPYPIPPNAPIEGGGEGDGDRHVLVVESTSCKLYELFNATRLDDGRRWTADSGAIFDLTSNTERPLRWTSADAAGLPIFAGLVRYDEVVLKKEIRHALRFTVSRSQAALVAPARHYASTNRDPSLPPMGLRVRMKADYDCSSYSEEAQVVCTALKRYGMIVADNGSDWYISGSPDPRWQDDALADLKQITGRAFEVVDTGPVRGY